LIASRSHSRRDDHGNDKKSRSMSRHCHSLEKSTRRAHASSRRAHEISRSGKFPSISPFKKNMRRHETYISQGELMKIKPPNFNCEHRKGEDDEAWMLEMNKYFQLCDYPSRVEDRIATYHLQ